MVRHSALETKEYGVMKPFLTFRVAAHKLLPNTYRLGHVLTTTFSHKKRGLTACTIATIFNISVKSSYVSTYIVLSYPLNMYSIQLH